jgi:peptide deformylase
MVDIENCHITHYPAQVLAEPAKPIEKIDDSIKKLVDKMADIMVEHKGVGLAGPQAGVPLRIFIISPDGKKENVRVFINPIVSCDGKTVSNEEGCLSVPGIFTKISRYKECTVTATGLDGKVFTEQAEGLYARALQHEFDHINGITIADKMSTVAKIAHRRKLQKLKDQQEK